MSEWTENSIGEILEHIADNRGKNPQSYCEMGVPVIDNYLITSDWRIDLTKTKRCIDAETYDSFIRKHIKEDDVLVTLVGNGYGSVAITPKEKCVIIQNTIGFRCNSDNDNKFLYYLLKGNRESLMNLNIGAAQPSIKVGNLLDLSFEFPSLPEQKAIANILGSLDDKIELNRKMNETLEGMAQALFKSWFVDFDPVIDNILVKNLKEYYSKNSSQEYPSPPPLPEGEELTDAKSLSPWERLGEGILYNGIPEEFRDRAEVRLSALRANAELGMLNVEIHNSSLSTHHSSLFPSAFRESEELGWIPEGWEARPLTKIFDINPSVKLSKGTVAPFADMKALPTKGYAIEAFIEKAYSGGAKFQNEDVLLA
nr:restriction endonuclease subunit S [Kiritimatiellia bacterium]